MRVISLGWGCQSFALAAMSALGILPKVDAVIHADTTHERSETYAFARKWTPWLEERGVKVVTVTANELTQESFLKNQIFMPAYTHGIDGKIERGQLIRSCTDRWKLQPIKRWLQANRNNEPVEMWLGITLDEIARMKESGVKYITNTYPLIETLSRSWTRGMVVQWLKDNGLEVPVKSACVFCPYHDRRTWREIKLSDNGDWKKAVEVDEAIRHKRPGYVCYLTNQLKPLVDCDFSSQEDHGQLSLWGDEECSGMCFL